ncbi:Sodium/potassium/calcium exchanger 5 [Dufourea novaeangliae]|uniref:Sodium/potassium/calcium exchanger 5 n=1 Tax=Dufourea novaeangliae TaxID=178035 RepID=A0A154PM61_DUFNO|nr:Sodium/potassium/calcium exchanger 5 [Dufourea novaeangliae]
MRIVYIIVNKHIFCQGFRKLLQLNSSAMGPGGGIEDTKNCTSPAIKEFPSDGLTRPQRQSGFIIVHFLIAIYMFLLLAIVCDDFFVPSIKKICYKINVTEDVAGATIMAAASSSPELFINIVGTFVTEGDLGVGTIVGSAVFNILAVPACCGLFANQVLNLEWWPVTRDSIAYAITVALLILTLRDGRIEWYEALILILVYILYISAMCFNRRINDFLQRSTTTRRKYKNLTEESPLIPNGTYVHTNMRTYLYISIISFVELTYTYKIETENTNSSFRIGLLESGEMDESPMRCPKSFQSETHLQNVYLISTTYVHMYTYNYVHCVSVDIVNMQSWPISACEKMWWVITWPINFVLLITIPDCRRHTLKSWYPLTFTMCIVWIATTSYIVGWVITIIGDTFRIPDSIMGLTFLAAGMSVPEAVSSVIVANQGHGAMGISNSIGSNVFDVLLCLGLPWFLKAAFFPKVPHEHYIKINSQGLIYSSISLFSTLTILYLSLVIAKFKLTRTVGIACLITYAIFLMFASILELNTFFVVNLPMCVD